MVILLSPTFHKTIKRPGYVIFSEALHTAGKIARLELDVSNSTDNQNRRTRLILFEIAGATPSP